MNLIPEARRDAVTAAFKATFGQQEVGSLTQISGGASGALICRIDIQNRPYVLRVEPERIAQHDRARGFECMTTAAAVGAAPMVHYADPVTGVAIIDFVSGRPISTIPGGAMGLAKTLGTLIAKVQAAPLFPGHGDYLDAIAGLLSSAARSPLLTPGALAPHAEALALIRSVLPWNAASLVSSHNDPNPRNTLFDGERLWLVDWELASPNDPVRTWRRGLSWRTHS